MRGNLVGLRLILNGIKEEYAVKLKIDCGIMEDLYNNSEIPSILFFI